MSINYETVPSPNYAAYANPGFGMALGQMLQGLPGQYMQGRENARTIEAQDAFKNGFPKNPDGTPDVNAIVDKGAKIGGYPFVQQMLPFLQNVAAGNASANDFARINTLLGGDVEAPSRPNNANAAGPGNLRAAPQPRLSANGGDVGDGPGAPTLRSMATEFVGGDRDATALISGAARNLKINPDKPLSADEAAEVKNFLGQSPKPFASSEDITSAPGPASAAERGSNGPSGAGGVADNGPGGRAAAPLMASSASGAPAPQAARTSGQAPQAPSADAGTASVAQASPAGLPPNYTEKAAQNREAVANYYRQQAARAAAMKNPELSTNYEKAAEFQEGIAKDIRAKIAENAALTGEGKNARDVAVSRSEGLKVAQKQELDRGDALQKGLQGSAREFETALKPHLDAMRGILNDPNFVSGTGEGFLTALNRIRSNPMFQGLPGYDPNAALPNEAIRKVVAASILNQTTELKAEAAEMGGSAGRLFQQQIELMSNAAQNPDSTAPSLRYLTELQTRMGDHARGVAELANNYDGKYGRGVLDNGFNEVLSKYNRDHPIFKRSEIDALAWAEKAGVRPGDPIKTPSGKVVAFDPSKFR
jgi:hypothetical protein